MILRKFIRINRQQQRWFDLITHRQFHRTARLNCGVLSYFYNSPTPTICSNDDYRSLLNGLNTLKHRGPDGAPSLWQNENKTVGLGHTRLSIIDLSDRGRQPLHSFDQKLHLSMNGELYDHDRIRRQGIEQDEYQFLSESDSEIALYLYRKYGFEFPKYLRGEFAITMYDDERKIFIAVRDRFGIKPLYYTYHDNKLLFASEIKALLAFGVPAVWNEEVIYNVGQMRSLQTVFKNIQQVPPAHLLIATENGTIHLSRYYEMSYITRDEEKNDERTEKEMIDGVHEHLLNAVRLRMRADVKVGVFLSGGLDSSAVLGIATTLTDQPIDTYSIAFKEHVDFNEQSLCIETNKHFGSNKTTQHIVEITHDQLAEHFDDFVCQYEYPLMATSPVGKYILSKVVQENHGKVVLTGEGSDEIFSGYVPFRQDYLSYDLPNDPSVFHSTTDEQREKIVESLSRNILSAMDSLDYRDREADCIQTMGYFPAQERSLMFAWHGIFAHNLKEKYEHFHLNSFYLNESTLYDYHIRQQMMNYEISRVHSSQYMMMKTILLNTLLKAYGDTAKMAHSVEGRLAFLDHYLVDYANRLPTKMKLKLENGSIVEKYILKEVARPYITEQVYRREKHPFASPPSLLNPKSKIYQYIQDTFNSKDVNQLKGLFDIERLREKLNNLHKNQESMNKQYLWGELAIMEGRYLMICSCLALAKRFNVKYT
ncbi:unnamed protein product [Adineta ricciae]|uniref:Asparagine synthetase [glutamine-hydrolyzing] n=1 Tax=Adineta ricciae TaxID=249248 RepID=A0A815H8E7_ADIRI|nr:unnamed protein product [Adineta ricciae]CAF1347638.1 unnamed protein product [Adineta ricciae]